MARSKCNSVHIMSRVGWHTECDGLVVTMLLRISPCARGEAYVYDLTPRFYLPNTSLAIVANCMLEVPS
jgi:hypothetical protein